MTDRRNANNLVCLQQVAVKSEIFGDFFVDSNDSDELCCEIIRQFLEFLIYSKSSFTMAIKIRQEQENDTSAIYNLIEAAFADMQESDHREHFLVKRLHDSDTFIPQLSLVAETDEKKIVGYILLIKVEIVSDTSVKASLGVAPLAVLPEFQRQGIGGMLLNAAHQKAASLGFGTAVLLGHKDYYPRFGYRKAIDFGIEFPFDVPHEFCMIVELIPHAIDGLNGTVRYPDVFFE